MPRRLNTLNRIAGYSSRKNDVNLRVHGSCGMAANRKFVVSGFGGLDHPKPEVQAHVDDACLLRTEALGGRPTNFNLSIHRFPAFGRCWRLATCPQAVSVVRGELAQRLQVVPAADILVLHCHQPISHHLMERTARRREEIDDPHSFTATLDQPSMSQGREVPGNLGLAQPEDLDHLANTNLPFAEQVQNSQPRLVTQRLE
jgi:hypothetical protein